MCFCETNRIGLACKIASIRQGYNTLHEWEREKAIRFVWRELTHSWGRKKRGWEANLGANCRENGVAKSYSLRTCTLR